MKLKFRTPWFLHKNDSPSENDAHSVDPSMVNPFERKKHKAACALNMCMVSLSQIVDYQNLEILKLEYDSILNNLNLEKIVKDEPLLKAVQAIMDACHFYILHAKDKEMLKKKQQARLKGALGEALGKGNVIAMFGSGNPWAIAAGAAAMVGVAAVNYKSQRDKAKLENEIDEWQLERSALEQLHNLRRTLFETAWRFAKKYNYPDEYRLTEKQIAVYNDLIKTVDPQTRYEGLWLIRDNFKAYPLFWYYLGRAALETSDAFRPDSTEGARKRILAYGEGDWRLSEEYRKKAIDAYETFKKCHLGNELMREDLVAASAYLDHAQLCDPDQPKQLAQIFDDVNRAYKLAAMDVEVVQACAFRYLQLYKGSDSLRALKDENGLPVFSDEEVNNIPQRAIVCLKFLMDRDSNPEINGRALSRLLKELNDKDGFSVLRSIVARRCPFVYHQLFPWDEETFAADWKQYVEGAGIKKSAFNLFYGLTWMMYKDFFCALYDAKRCKSYAPLKAFRDRLRAKYKDAWVDNLHDPLAKLNEKNEVDGEEGASEKKSEEIQPPTQPDSEGPQNEGILHSFDLVLEVAEAINNPAWVIASKAWDAYQKNEEKDKSLAGLILNLLDDSFERVAWKLFLGTRASEFVPTIFETREKQLFAALLESAKGTAESFADEFKSNEAVRGIKFSYETVVRDKREPDAFQLLSCIERKAERQRVEIQELLGGSHRFWYPDPKFVESASVESTLIKESMKVQDDISGVKQRREIVRQRLSGDCSRMHGAIASLTPNVCDAFRAHEGGAS